MVQEVFVKAYRSLDRFREDARLGTWLYRITVNACIDARRRKRFAVSRQTTSLEADDTLEPQVQETRPHADPERSVHGGEIHRHVDRAIESLTPIERAVFTLRLYNELRVPEIAETLDRAEGTIKNLLFRATRKVRKELVKSGVTLEPEEIR
jgi:RNA polymerase sigma-70 factor (ECF subfamily)